MKELLNAGRLLLIDMASTVFFLFLYWLTGSLMVSVALGMALGVGQIVWEVVRRRPIDTMQWVSLVVIVASGSATLITHDVRFMMAKLSVAYTMIGIAMLKRGWLDRYQPPIAHDLLPDVIVVFGFVWAGLMFFSAAVNAFIALRYGVVAWASFMTAYGLVSKLALFFAQYGIMRVMGRRRYLERQAASGLA